MRISRFVTMHIHDLPSHNQDKGEYLWRIWRRYLRERGAPLGPPALLLIGDMITLNLLMDDCHRDIRQDGFTIDDGKGVKLNPLVDASNKLREAWRKDLAELLDYVNDRGTTTEKNETTPAQLLAEWIEAGRMKDERKPIETIECVSEGGAVLQCGHNSSSPRQARTGSGAS